MAVHQIGALGGLMLGAPAGPPELPEWAALLGADGTAVPFLRYFTPASGSHARMRRCLA